MIISASRRTDIPAFYSEWFINRIRAGYCAVPNPFNRDQVSYVSLKPEHVDVIVFWTRNPRPLLPFLDELDHRGFRYYFQYTIIDNPKEIDPKSPPLATALTTFQQLSQLVGNNRVIWRYDPIIFSQFTGTQFHKGKYHEIAQALEGYTSRSVISVVDIYAKAKKRLRELKEKGIEIVDYQSELNPHLSDLMSNLVETASQHQMEIFSCSERLDLTPYGILPGKCVDDVYIEKTFGLQVAHKKDPSQREECGCVVSKDIGMYDTCLFGCQYCYATQSFERARLNYQEHNSNSPSLVGWYEAHDKKAQEKKNNLTQGRMFDLDEEK